MSASGGAAHRHADLLRRLSEPEAFGKASSLGCGRIALFRRVGGATLGAGYASAAAIEALVAEGLAAWSGEGRERRLGLVEGGALTSAEVAVEGASRRVLLDMRESPLLWLRRRPGKDGKPQISDAEFAAGERFRADLTLAAMLPRTTMNWDAFLTPEARGPGRSDPATGSDATIAARQRVARARDRLGPELSGLAIDVCGFLKGLDQVERERGWPARSAKIVLRLALSSLAGHYGLEAGHGRSNRESSTWRAPDARPTIAARR